MILVGVAMVAGMMLGNVRQQAGFANAGPIIGAVYIAMSVLYLYPGLCLLRYASAISAADSSGQMSQVVEALIQQKKFWKFCGVFVAVILGFYVLMFALGILVALFG